MASALEDLAERLETLPVRDYHVACMPDFFLDHFVEVPDWDHLVPRMREVHDRGGGNLPGYRQHLQSGGNAANTALALARLGVRTHLVCRTSPFGGAYLRETLGVAGVDLTHVKADGDLAVTTALEFGAEKRNVMLNDSGSLRDFGPERLDDNDWALVEGADLVLIANWVQNFSGTELIREVCRRAKSAGTWTYVDTGDPSPRADDLSAFLKELLASPDLDILGMNENEARQFVDALGLVVPDDPLAAARALALRRPGVLDLHTAHATASWARGAGEETRVPTFPVRPRRATGAGDAWNAGNILGHLAGLSPAERLHVANATAGLYVSGDEGLHPGIRDVCAFLRARAELEAAR